MSSSTSDYERDASDVLWVIWILHGVHSLVPLAHTVYNEVAELAVEFGPSVAHDAVPHQDHFGRPRRRPVAKRDQQAERGQQDVEVLPVEQRPGLLLDWIIRWQKMEEALSNT